MKTRNVFFCSGFMLPVSYTSIFEETCSVRYQIFIYDVCLVLSQLN